MAFHHNIHVMLSYNMLIGMYAQPYRINMMLSLYHFLIFVVLNMMLGVSFFAAPLDPNPMTEMDRRIIELRLKYRTYMVEIDIEYVCGFVMVNFPSICYSFPKP